jgi:PAS domain S-box-containing protein
LRVQSWPPLLTPWWRRTAKGFIRVWNPGAERIFGHRANEALGESLDLIIPESLRALHWEGFCHVMATGESHYGEGDFLSVPGLRQDGQRISLTKAGRRLAKDDHSGSPARR